MKYPAKNPAKFLKPEPEPDIEAGYPAGSGFSRISGRIRIQPDIRSVPKLNHIYWFRWGLKSRQFITILFQFFLNPDKFVPLVIPVKDVKTLCA